MSRMECLVHVECVHQVPREQRPLFCEICLRSFSDKKLIEQHKLFHERIKTMIKTGDLEVRF
jgi:hypothetical protein